MTPHDPTDHGDVWCQVVAATDYLAATTLPDFTVWHGLAHAAAAWAAALVGRDATEVDVAWDDPDPLRTALERLLATTALAGPAGAVGEPPLHDVLTAALRTWLDRVEDEVNDGQRFGGVWRSPPTWSSVDRARRGGQAAR